MRSAPKTELLADRPIFICYRQVDGKDYARWIYSALKKSLESKSDSREIYFDQTAPSTGDWTSIHGAALQRAGSMIVICTPGLYAEHESNDWVHQEIDWWLNNRTVPPILVDVTGEGLRWVPAKIRTRWPNAQRVNVNTELLDETDDQKQSLLASQVAEQILGGISGTQFEIVQQDLAAAQRRNRWLIGLTIGLVVLLSIAVALAVYANRQRNIANRNLSAALAERALRVGRDDYSLGLLLAAEALGYADSFEARNTFITLLQLNSTVKRVFPGSIRILVNPDERSIVLDQSVWEIGSGRSTPVPFVKSSAKPLAFRSDGRVVAFCEHRRKSIELVDLNTSQLLAEFELPDCLGAKGVFPPSRDQILVAVKGHIYSWDLQTRQPTVTALEKWAGEDIVLDSQALLAAGGNKSGTVTAWDVNTGKLLNSSTEHNAEITALAFNNDAKLLASADENGAIVVWSVQPLQPKTKALKHHEGVQSLAFTPDGLQLAAGGPTHIGGVANFDKSVFRLSMWNVNTGALYNSNFEVRSPIWYLRFTDGGRQLIAGGMTEIRLFDVSQDVAFQSTEQNAATNVTQPKLIAISDRVIASIHHDLLTVKSQLDQQPVIEYRIPAGVEPLSLKALDGTVAVGGKDGSLLVTEPTHGTLKLIGRHPSEAGVLAFSPDRQLLAAAGNQGSVSVWSVERAESVWSQKVAGAIRAVAFAADGTVAAGGWASDSSIGFLFLLGRNRSKEVPQVQGVSTLAFSADGTTLAVGHGTSILLLDTNTLNRFEGLYHGEQIGSQRYAIMAESLAFSPDDKLLLSAAADGRVRVFDVLERKRLGIGFVIPGVPDKFDFLKEDRQLDLSHLTVRQDGAVAVVANGAVVYWQLGRLAEARETACAIANRNFTPEEWQEFFPGTTFSVTCLGRPVWTREAAGSGSPSPSFEAVFE